MIKAPHTQRVGLTKREKEVLQHLTEGQSTKKIAEILMISENTVANHRKNIMKKMDIKTSAELTRFSTN